MKYVVFLTLFIFTPSFAQFLWNYQHLNNVKNSLKESSSPYKKYLEELKANAIILLSKKDLSVIQKKHLPASGDIHDYSSLSRYYWPDPSKKDGLPYIFKDGKSNPELKEYDREVLDKVSQRLQILTLTWFFTDDTLFANAALSQIRTWFISEKTRMNPNMNYAQIIPGKNHNKGNSFGIIDGYSFVQMLDAIKLLETYSKFTKSDNSFLKQWFKNYVNWLTSSVQGIQESKATNNHGTTYDTQLLAYSLFINDNKTAQNLVQNFAERHILKQIEEDGTQPKELKRTLSFHYSWYNLSHMLDFFIIAKNHNLNIDNAVKIKNHSFFKALDYLAFYIGDNDKLWQYKQLSNMSKVKQELIKDIYRTYIFLDNNKISYRNIFYKNKGFIKDYLFHLLYVSNNDL